MAMATSTGGARGDRLHVILKAGKVTAIERSER
jgi:hypothetical protein